MLFDKKEFNKLRNKHILSSYLFIGTSVSGHQDINSSANLTIIIGKIGIFISEPSGKKAIIHYKDITDVRLNFPIICISSNDSQASYVEIILNNNRSTNKIFNIIKDKSINSLSLSTKKNINPLSSFFDIFKINQYKTQIQKLENKLINIGADEYFEVQKKVSELNSFLQQKEIEKAEILSQINQEKYSLLSEIDKAREQLYNLQSKIESLEKTFQNQKNKIEKSKEIYKSINYCIDKFFYDEFQAKEYHSLENSINELSPSVTLKLHSMDIKSLKKEFKENDKYIDKILKQYSERYSTKANKAIYELMVIGLRAELQNILYNLKYEKLDTAIEQVKSMTNKYLQITSDGNQTIASTLVKFIGEIEYFFINAVKIEYNYYVKKEQARQEQLAIRQQMKEEAEERKQLLNQQKQIEVEETKYNNEINKISSLISENTDSLKIAELEAKLLELQSKLSDVTIKKDEIIKLQNGKAGHVYIISNIGSFGENVFKIGMTRRLDPQERIDELGNASVPFKFDVHSFIFSDDAVSLEKKLHSILNDKRVNKVNLRKEFFNVTIDELENLVTEIEPTAEFIKTMQAQEFNESISANENYFIDEQLIAN